MESEDITPETLPCIFSEQDSDDGLAEKECLMHTR